MKKLIEYEILHKLKYSKVNKLLYIEDRFALMDLKINKSVTGE